MTVLLDTTAASPIPAVTRMPLIGVLRSLLLLEAVATLALAIVLSLLASGLAAETTVRFAAGGALLFAIFAAIAARGARRRRSWSWTMAAILQVLLAIGTGIAILTAEWHPAYLAGFALATAVMLVLSVESVRRALGQA